MANPQFGFAKDFQIKILSLMLHDFDFLLTVYDIIKPEYFSDIILSWFFEAIRDHYLDFNTQMNAIILRNEMKKASEFKRIKDSDVGAFISAFRKIVEPAIDREYVAKEVITFCRHQAVKRAIMEMPPLLAKNEFDEINRLFNDALRTGTSSHDTGTQYFLTWPQRLIDRALRKEQKVMAVGISELDKYLGGGLRAKQLGLWMAPTSRGKSLALVHCGKRAVIMKRKVLHYTMELGESDIAERYDASFSRIKLINLIEQEHELAARLEGLGNVFGNTLIIKYYPMHSPTIHTIKSHLNKCMGSGFIPDLIIIDYLDLLKASDTRAEKREQLTELTLDVCNLAKEFDVPIWSATQSRRDAYSKETHGEEDIADDIGKAMHTDILITLNQTRKELKDKTLRLLLAKNRNGPRGVSVTIQSDFDRMCFYDPVREFDHGGAPIRLTSSGVKRPPPKVRRIK